MRVGLFFGSFDPPHIGHVNVVMGAINSNQVDRVLVIPAYQNLWKEDSSKFHYRHAMCDMTFDNLPGVRVSDIERDIRRDAAGSAYPRGIPTYVVLEELKSRMPEDELVIITTPETYKDIPEWHKGSVILYDYKFLMVVSGEEVPQDLPENVHVVYVPQITICSTCIRNRVKLGIYIQPFVRDTVEAFIDQYRLYV